MMNSSNHSVGVDPPEKRPFHPREIWTSVVLMVIGMLIGAAAAIKLSWTIAAIAAGVFAVGMVLAWDGHIFRDVHQGSPASREVDELEHPGDSEGVEPDQMGHDVEDSSPSRVPARIRGTPTRHSRALAVAPSPSASAKATACGFLVLLAGVWLFVVPWLLTNGLVGRSVVLSHWRDMVVASVALLAGLRAVLTRGASAGAAVCALVAGGALMLFSAMSSVPEARIRVNEIAVGAVIFATAALQLGYGWNSSQGDD